MAGAAVKIGSLCTGTGMLDKAALAVFGGELAWVADTDEGARVLLAHRYPDVPNLGDITAVDWRAIREVGIMTAGFPCQPVSAAGRKLGKDDERWLWPQVRRAVRDLRPGLLFLENVSDLVVRGLDDVLGSLAEIGYDCRWTCLCAADAGAPHLRERWFAVACFEGRFTLWEAYARWRKAVVNSDGARLEGDSGSERADGEPAPGPGDFDWGIYLEAVRAWESVLGRRAPVPVVPGKVRARENPAFAEWLMGFPEGWVTAVPGLSWKQQIQLAGNGAVPQQAELALRILLSGESEG